MKRRDGPFRPGDELGVERTFPAGEHRDCGHVPASVNAAPPGYGTNGIRRLGASRVRSYVTHRLLGRDTRVIVCLP